MGSLWRAGRDRLAGRGISTAALDAKLLVGHALGLDALALSVRENELVPELVQAKALRLLDRRMAGEPVGRILGHREFYGLDFALGPATLEPRPDTELLVDLVIEKLAQGGQLLDLGTGSGCIPIAVLANRPDALAIATDLAAEALDVAAQNAVRNGVAARLKLAQGNWFEALSTAEAQSADARFDVIVANPPYIASDIIATLAPEVRSFDPLLALDGGADGLSPYRIIAAQAAAFLRSGGWVMVEIGHDQGVSVASLFETAGFCDIAVHKDLAGLDRVVVAHHMGGNHSAVLPQA